MARPRKHDRPALIKTICAAVSDGALVKDACAAQGLTPDQLRDWVQETPELSALYARAREEQAHAMAEECIRIADGTDADAEDRVEALVRAVEGADEEDKDRILAALTHQAVQRDKLRLDARKWLTGKIAPRLYGDKLQQELTGKDGAPLPDGERYYVILGGQKVPF
jgi:hypothetical protein